MTLTSHFRTDAPVNPHRIHEFITGLVNPSGREVRIVPAGPDRWAPKANELRNAAGQGLDALVWTTFGEDGPLRIEGYDIPYEDYPEEEYGPAPAAMVDVSMDSSYGFMKDGMGCREFHTGLFRALDAYVLAEFPEAGNHWYNEFSGTWHKFGDHEGWKLFSNDGQNASAWFDGTVLPLLQGLK